MRGVGHGLAAVTLGIGLVSTVMIGGAWAVAASMRARSDLRSAVFPSSLDRMTGPEQQGVSVEFAVLKSPPAAAGDTFADRFGSDALRPLQVASFQLASADPDADPVVTGSIGSSTIKLPPAQVVPENHAVALAPPVEAVPVPKARPKLAALTPMDGLPKQDEVAVRTAVYDITAKIVYLPNGERLEAHSGFGQFMDDPRHVHRRMRGATPPGVYNLRFRESLFHGVKAIRMLPENESLMFGRDGILAHTYMLGPSGQSNGCVSFRDYNRFLRAFERGEFNRMIVVPRLAKPPTFASRERATG